MSISKSVGKLNANEVVKHERTDMSDMIQSKLTSARDNPVDGNVIARVAPLGRQCRV